MVSLLRDWFVDPLALLFLLSLGLLIMGFWGRWTAAARVVVSVWILGCLLISAPKIVNPLVAVLEDRYRSPASCLAGQTIVVLGGGVDSRAVSSTEFERMQPSTLARLATAERLARDNPTTPIVVAGGALRDVSEAAVMADLLSRLGIAEERLLLEDQSMNTWANAVNVAALLGARELPRDVQLVTSALHMTRAKNAFEKNGVVVCPVAVDFQSIENIPAYALMPQTTALAKFDKLLHELVALAVYRLIHT